MADSDDEAASPLPTEQIKAYNRVIKNAFESLRFRDDVDAITEEAVSLPTIKFRCYEFIQPRTFTWEVLETVRFHHFVLYLYFLLRSLLIRYFSFSNSGRILPMYAVISMPGRKSATLTIARLTPSLTPRKRFHLGHAIECTLY